ncbi:hypothetical protein BV898_09674 [Hypsibius exemplaris]|uniref:Gustatory receptor n=1 Tax=Hypsibius exemplaris TaxID=2072580 RepID=A0A1W0WLU9_HYPEX|nr:hypothetical protein BV898_09674 [Hypsibius exemplaris]
MENALKLPLTVLQTAGIIPFAVSRTSKPAKPAVYASRCFYFTLMVSSLAQVGFRSAIAVAKSIDSAPINGANSTLQIREPTLIDVLIDAVDIFQALRGPAVLLIFLIHSRHIHDFLQDFIAAVRTVFRDDRNLLEALSKRWCRSTFACVLLTFAVLTFWEATSWYFTYGPYGIKYTSNSRSFLFIGIEIRIWACILWWLLSVTISYFLSQMLCVIVFVAGNMMADALAKLNRTLQEQIRNVERGDSSRKVVAGSLKAVEFILPGYHGLHTVAGTANQLLGGVFCVAYTFDVLSVVCYIAALLNSDLASRNATVHLSCDILGILIFGSYTCCFVIPWVVVSERSQEFLSNISLLANGLAHREGAPDKATEVMAERTENMLAAFQAGGSRMTIDFSGYGILRASRGQVLTTFTALISLGLVAHNLFRQPDTTDCDLAELADVCNKTLAIVKFAASQ